MCAKIRLISNTPSRNVLVTDYVTCFFSASSRFTHSLCSLHVSAWYRFRFSDPIRMTNGPGSGGVTNVLPGAMVTYTLLDKSPQRYPYVPHPLLNLINTYFFHHVPHCGQSFVVGCQWDFRKRTMWEAGHHFFWGRHSNGHLGFDSVAMSLVG